MSNTVRSFEFPELNEQNSSVDGLILDQEFQEEKLDTETIRSEIDHAKGSGFSFLGVVEEHRGLKSQAESDFREVVRKEVAERIEEIKEQSIEEGAKRGEDKAYEQALNRYEEDYKVKLDEIGEFFDSIKDQQKEILNHNKASIVQLVRALGQWIGLKYLDDEEYIERLVDKLIREVSDRRHLKVKYRSGQREIVIEAVEKMKSEFQEIHNVRFEEDSSITDPRGVIVETSNEILDGSIEQQMGLLGELFESVDE